MKFLELPGIFYFEYQECVCVSESVSVTLELSIAILSVIVGLFLSTFGAVGYKRKSYSQCFLFNFCRYATTIFPASNKSLRNSTSTARIPCTISIGHGSLHNAY